MCTIRSYLPWRCIVSLLVYGTSFRIGRGMMMMMKQPRTTKHNNGACRTQGYFVQLSVAPLLYFCTLFLYYMLVISFAFSEQRLTTVSKRLICSQFRMNWEQVFHFGPIIISFITATAGLPLNLYHPSGVTSWCWIAPSPEEIQQWEEEEQGSNFDSIRVPAFQWGFFLGPACFSFGAMIISLFIIFRGVQSQEERMKKYVTASLVRVSCAGSVASQASFSKESSHNHNNHHHRHRHQNYAMNTSSMSNSQSTTANDFQNSGHTPTDPPLPPASLGSLPPKPSMSVGRKSICMVISHPYSSFKEYWRHRPRTRQVVVQCGCYVSAFFCSQYIHVDQPTHYMG